MEFINLIKNGRKDKLIAYISNNREFPESFMGSDMMKRNALHYASAPILILLKKHLSKDIISSLINEKDKYGATPIFLAIWSNKVRNIQSYYTKIE